MNESVIVGNLLEQLNLRRELLDLAKRQVVEIYNQIHTLATEDGFTFDWDQLGPGIVIYGPTGRKGNELRVHTAEEAQALINALRRVFGVE